MRRIDIGTDSGHETMAYPVQAGQRFLVMEDDWLVSMALQDILSELGCRVVGTAGDVESALQLVRTASFDAAIVDYWLHDKVIDPVADILLKRSVPFALATGFGIGDVNKKFRHVPLLTKPYLSDDVRDVVEQLAMSSTGTRVLPMLAQSSQLSG